MSLSTVYLPLVRSIFCPLIIVSYWFHFLAWHSDVTYERQPPSLTALFLFDSPASGGDTGYADQRLAYEHLSPKFREYLETLQVLHSGVAQAEYSRKGLRGGIVKREPVENIHPLVRRHP